MTVLDLVLLASSCILATTPSSACLTHTASVQPESAITRTGKAVDVALTAEAALAWDVASGQVLYEKEAQVKRPIASLSKLLTVLVVRQTLPLDTQLTVPTQVRAVQRAGAHIRLVPGEHARVAELLKATLVASANDAAVTLAIGSFANEDAFIQKANEVAPTLGLQSTQLANATGLTGGEQHSTAYDVQQLLQLVYRDEVLRDMLDEKVGVLTSKEGTVRRYTSTNKLLDTYLPVKAAKTGYTTEAGENIALITTTPTGQEIGIIILGSADRFTDAKVLAEWLKRNYTWAL